MIRVSIVSQLLGQALPDLLVIQGPSLASSLMGGAGVAQAEVGLSSVGGFAVAAVPSVSLVLSTGAGQAGGVE